MKERFAGGAFARFAGGAFVGITCADAPGWASPGCVEAISGSGAFWVTCATVWASEGCVEAVSGGGAIWATCATAPVWASGSDGAGGFGLGGGDWASCCANDRGGEEEEQAGCAWASSDVMSARGSWLQRA